MTPHEKEILVNIRRSAEASLKYAQTHAVRSFKYDNRCVDGFQHILDLVSEVEFDKLKWMDEYLPLETD